MKVGVITFHRAFNYGAVLQCYALVSLIRNLGHDVRVIDYRQSWTEEAYKYFSFRILNERYFNVYDKIKYIISSILGLKRNIYRNKIYKNFLHEYIPLTDKCHSSIPQDFDAYVLGSDQLWGMSCLGNSLDDVYLGNFSKNKGSLMIAYAISTNESSLRYMNEHKILTKSISNFNAFSFRELNAINFVYNQIQQKVEHCIDPTLLLEAKDWDGLVNESWSKRNYVLLYCIRGEIGSNYSLKEKAENIAKKLGCEVLNLAEIDLPITEFVSAFKYAKYVITTSFHATAFSVIFERPLAAFVLHDGHDSRYVDLLKSIGGDHLIYETDKEPNIDVKCIYDENLLFKVRSNSISYLKNNLN